MAAPTTIVDAETSTGVVNVTTLTCDMTAVRAACQVGDKVALFCCCDGTATQSVSSGADWSAVVRQEAAAGAQANLAFFEFTVTVAGTCPNLVIALGGSQMAVARWKLVRGSGTLTRLGPTSVGGDSANPDPPSLTNGAGSVDALVIAVAGADNSALVGPSTAGPAGYSNFLTSNISNSQGATLGLADKAITGMGASEDPGTFTLGSEQWAAMTLLYYVTAAAGTTYNDTYDAGITISASLASAATYPVTFSESLTLTDPMLTATATMSAVYSETTTPAADMSAGAIYDPNLAESLNAAITHGAELLMAPALNESLTAADSYSSGNVFLSDFAESLVADEALAAGLVLSALVSENLTPAEATSELLTMDAAVVESVTVGDQVVDLLTFAASLTETIGLAVDLIIAAAGSALDPNVNMTLDLPSRLELSLPSRTIVTVANSQNEALLPSRVEVGG